MSRSIEIPMFKKRFYFYFSNFCKIRTFFYCYTISQNRLL